MHHELLSEVSSGWACDNGMVAMSIRAGEPVDPHELLELSSGVKALFSLATLVCRGTDRIADCHRIWTDTLETLRKARTVWADVPINDDPLLLFYLQQLERLCELAAARVDLYTISQSERLAYATAGPTLPSLLSVLEAIPRKRLKAGPIRGQPTSIRWGGLEVPSPREDHYVCENRARNAPTVAQAKPHPGMKLQSAGQ
jgi:hypothetical protein